jgi:hypothetical protein
MRRFLAILVSFLFFSASSTAVFASCDDFLNEFETTSLGVSYKKDPETGRITALMMMGEANFLSPKSSLVRKAKKKALMNAKAEFVRFMKEDFSAADLTADLTNSIEKTDQDGNTTGAVEEISSMAEIMSSSAESVISGIVVLGECVDKSEKVAMVLAGWKPELSAAAADAKQASSNPTPSVSNSALASDGEAGEPSSSTVGNTSGGSGSGASSTPSKKVGITIITVEAEGEGGNLKQATNEAIRSAIAQVLGEKFASSQLSTDFTATAEVSNSEGQSAGVAVETSTQYEVQASEVKGILSGYKYITKQELSDGIKVVLQVEIPKYESSIDNTKNTLIVFKPEIKKIDGLTSSEANEITSEIRNGLENILNESGKLEVLDRAFLKKRQIELGTVAAGNNSMSEMARIGNLAGADFMLVTEFEKLSSEVEERKVGNNLIVRQKFNGSANFKLIEVATSNIISSGSVPIRRLKFKKDNSLSLFSDKISISVSRQITRKIGGKVNASSGGSANDTQNVRNAEKRADESMKKLEESVKDDW